MFDFEAVRQTLAKLQRSYNRSERSLFKKLIWVIVAIIVVIGLATFGYRQVRNWQVRRLSAEANELVNRGDYKRAGLEARRILQINPESAEGTRIIARIAERAGSRAAVELRQRIVTLPGANNDDYFALARAAIRFGDLTAAKGALEKLSPPAKNTAEFHAVQADIALAQRDGTSVERELSEAIRLEPANKDYAFRLAVLRLGASDLTVRDKARETLKQMQTDKVFRREATRQLINDAFQRQDFAAALTLARQLDELPEKDFRDRLALLTVLYEVKDPGFRDLLTQLESAAAKTPEDVGALLSWLNTHKMSTEAIAWSAKIPPAFLTQKSVPLALADVYISVGDWNNLERLTKNGSWGGAEFLRMALRARAFREMGDMAKFTAQWNEAVKKVTPDPDAILMLSETAAAWGWRGEVIDLLWLAAKDSAKGPGALRTLYDYFAKSGDTQNLYRVLLHMHELRPNDYDIQNNLAQISLLLNLNIDRGQKLAHDVYEKDPKNPAYVSTYAFALFVHGEAPRAVKLFSGLSDAQLRAPSIALYYGIVLAGVGDSDRAAEFLDLGQKASLLPEEKALLEKARRSLAQR